MVDGSLRSGRVPNFIVIGAMKAGTTSLYEYLRNHPEIFMPDVKELDYFSHEHNWKRGWDWYLSHFVHARPNHLAVGEASTRYSCFPEWNRVPERIATHIPDVRLIYCVRQPIERIESQYLHMVSYGREKLPIDRAVLENPWYVDFSSYALQIERYLDHFPREQLLVIRSEDLRSRREETLRHVYRFIGVDVGWTDPAVKSEFNQTRGRFKYPAPVAAFQRMLVKRSPKTLNRLAAIVPSRVKQTVGRPLDVETQGPRKVSPHVRAELVARLKDDLEKLKNHVDDSFTIWEL